ncbi:glycosyltransferase family 39 protein [Salinibacterium sp. G-O1]|uniref:glycosyltransferase family 39 protein n=1 Tax=Salinibacterium sp. G-O1 TaxID=3046208 RepID=UPI0024BB26A5|nr:glycosyltransferase family 39 protein [Salinibacterium sp. G-O1]MDJ0335922.1 glycosyltransferase family 39 protein [Salinibacterium sp. G-O1]
MTATIARESDGTRQRLRRRATLPLLAGLLGFTISMIGITIPGLWYDEAATVISTTRSWTQLWAELGNVDAVHALYYAVMHLVFDVFGYSPLSLRMPSAIAVGIAAALVVILGRQLGRPRLAIIAAVAFCLIPRVTWMGTEGRSYALTATLAILATVVLVRAIRLGTRGSWVLYGFVALLSVTVFIYLALVIVAHAVTVAWLLAERSGRARLNARNWLISAGVAGVLSIPFVLETMSQSGQISWIGPLTGLTVQGVLRSQWFYSSEAFAIAAWAFTVVGVIVMVRALVLARRVANGPAGHAARTFLAVVLPAMLVPTLALLFVSAVYQPIYQPRYLSMCTPFVALAIAAGIDAIRWRPASAMAVALLVVLALPQVTLQRTPETKEFSSWAQVADLIAAERASDGPDSTTAIIYGELWGHAKATTRAIAYSYPEQFESTVDVTILTPAAETAQLWETRAPIAESLDRLDGTDVAYLITSTTRDLRPATTEALASVGWHVTDEWSFTHVNVLRYVRD